MLATSMPTLPTTSLRCWEKCAFPDGGMLVATRSPSSSSSALGAAYHSSTPAPHLCTSPPPAPRIGRGLRNARAAPLRTSMPSHEPSSCAITRLSRTTRVLRPSVRLASLHFYINRLLITLAHARYWPTRRLYLSSILHPNPISCSCSQSKPRLP